MSKLTRKQRKMFYRIIASTILLIAAVLISKFFIAEGSIINLFMFLIPYAVIGWDIIWKAIRNIAHGQIFDENFLMAIATIGAIALGDYPEAVFVMLFYQVGELFQSYAVGRSRKSISDLMDIRPDYANIEVDGKLTQVDPESVNVGDIIVVKAGEKVPLDGIIVEGNSAVNTSALTGESLPRDLSVGDEIISGCINQTGLLRVKVNNTFGESTVSKILELVENSSNKKAKTENFITKFAKFYTPVVVIGALLLAVLPPLFFGGVWAEWVERALIFLVISCPCALVISIPLSFFGGIGGASRSGILVKGANYLEALSETETVVFDKTGTLTQGTFKVTAVHPEEIGEEKLLMYAAYAESYSDHPISISLRDAYEKEIDTTRVTDFVNTAGEGITAKVDGHVVAAGNDKLMLRIGAQYNSCSLTGTTVHVAIDGKYAGHIIISDEIKPDSKETISALKELGIKRTVMLTGDSNAVGEAVASELKLDDVYTELLPADKVEKVEALLEETSDKGKLAFVGDGINDAPVLSRSDIGIAMGALGSDAAIEAADIVLMDDKPSKIAAAIKISKKTLRIVRQNIIFSLAVKFAVLILAALGLTTMWSAIFADVGVMVIAVINATRALNAGKNK